MFITRTRPFTSDTASSVHSEYSLEGLFHCSLVLASTARPFTTSLAAFDNTLGESASLNDGFSFSKMSSTFYGHIGSLSKKLQSNFAGVRLSECTLAVVHYGNVLCGPIQSYWL